MRRPRRPARPRDVPVLVLDAGEAREHAQGVVLARLLHSVEARFAFVAVGHLRELAQDRLEDLLPGRAAVLPALEQVLRALAEAPDARPCARRWRV
ncbi:MAG: hypothetical protein ACLRRW_08145 [Collinsella intestinalis]